MSDIKSPEERSRNMAAIKSKNTKPELVVRHLLFARGYRYRICSGKIPGHPDLWLRKYNTAVFVHGCFWHRHPGCRYAYTPKSRLDFWSAKFERNVQRDAEVRKELSEKGIRCLVIWECTVENAMKKSGSPEALTDSIEAFLRSSEPYGEL